MGIYEELVARGLIAQVTNEEEIREMVNAGKAKFYIGFDCTADSLTAGHFMALTLMKRLQMAGNQPIALIGGGTTIGGGSTIVGGNVYNDNELNPTIVFNKGGGFSIENMSQNITSFIESTNVGVSIVELSPDDVN
mgnify:CR=1 FL=1